jgi:hypothetical protein
MCPRLNVIQPKRATRNFVELLDFINRTKYSRSVHPFDVINGTL